MRATGGSPLGRLSVRPSSGAVDGPAATGDGASNGRELVQCRLHATQLFALVALFEPFMQSAQAGGARVARTERTRQGGAVVGGSPPRLFAGLDELDQALAMGGKHCKPGGIRHPFAKCTIQPRAALRQAGFDCSQGFVGACQPQPLLFEPLLLKPQQPRDNAGFHGLLPACRPLSACARIAASLANGSATGGSSGAWVNSASIAGRRAIARSSSGFVPCS